MKVLVDTCAWSLVLRRDEPDTRLAALLADLVAEHRVVMVGPIRQELLSGVKNQRQFDRLRQHLAAFPDLPLEREDYEAAAGFYNRCRRRGIAGSSVDFLLCAVASRRDLAILTVDPDFTRYAKRVPITLFELP